MLEAAEIDDLVDNTRIPFEIGHARIVGKGRVVSAVGIAGKH